jgi:threonine aldolase
MDNNLKPVVDAMIELRSDTFTLPTPQMLEAIMTARLGNDGYREDPTVLELERLAAGKLGKEAACLLPSGTMANLCSLLAHGTDGDNVILVGDRSDIYVYEREGSLVCKGLTYEPLPTERNGTLRTSDLRAAFARFRSKGGARVAAVCLENPHNLNGGVVLPDSYVEEVAELVHAHGAHLHLDGARIFNAAVASKTTAAELARHADSVQFCLSKGLSAPVGSLALGRAEFVDKVRGIRKVLGGTMRQAGIIAAAGIVALDQMVERLADDHHNARRLAEGLARMTGLEIDLTTVQTNNVVFRVIDERFTCESFIATAQEHGLQLCEFKFGRVRAAVHRGVTAGEIDQALTIFAEILATGPLEEAVYSAQAHG